MNRNKSYYGNCPRCNTELIVGESAVLDEEKVENGHLIKTGKKIYTVGFLQCPNCLKKVIVDDSFDFYINKRG